VGGGEPGFHGGDGLNVVFKTPPHIPDPGEWEAETSFGPADAANLSAWGFNAIRLLPVESEQPFVHQSLQPFEDVRVLELL